MGYVDSLEGKSYELILFLKPQAHAIFLQPPLAETPRPSVVRPPDRNWQPLESHEHNRWRPRSNYRVRISWHLVGSWMVRWLGDVFFSVWVCLRMLIFFVEERLCFLCFWVGTQQNLKWIKLKYCKYVEVGRSALMNLRTLLHVSGS